MITLKNPAGFLHRACALILDLVLIMVIFNILRLLLSDFSYDGTIRSFNFPEMLYFLLLPILWHGYTVGKGLAGVRIVRIDGRDVGIGTMIMREIVAGILYTLTLGILTIVSIFMVSLREDKRSLHDLIAGTYVTHNRPE